MPMSCSSIAEHHKNDTTRRLLMETPGRTSDHRLTFTRVPIINYAKIPIEHP